MVFLGLEKAAQEFISKSYIVIKHLWHFIRTLTTHKSNVNLTFVQCGVGCYAYSFHVSECHESYQDENGRIFKSNWYWFYEHVRITRFLYLYKFYYILTCRWKIRKLHFVNQWIAPIGCTKINHQFFEHPSHVWFHLVTINVWPKIS